MKRLLVCLAIGMLGASAHAQTPDIDALLADYVAKFNKGDAAGLASDVYRIAGEDAAATEARLAGIIKPLREEAFGRIDLFGTKVCPVAGDRAQAEMRFAYLYTFGGYMEPGEQAVVFDLAKTDDGWRITGETAHPFSSAFSCAP